MFLYYRPNENSRIVNIFYSALNFKDVLLASGKMQSNLLEVPPTAPITHLGFEFSGMTEGKKVMGICTYGAMGLQCKADLELMWEVPHHWSLEDAATVPIVYSTVSFFTYILY